MNTRALQGARAYYKGRAAEEGVIAAYQALGWGLEAQRARAFGAELDLIFKKAGMILFVEVKAAASFEAAAFSLTSRQKERLLAAAEAYLAAKGGAQARFDLALVDGAGRLQLLENALFS